MDFNSVLCDWMTGRHDFAVESPAPVIEAGKVLKIDREGVIEYEALSWEQIRCPSSDTSIRIKCDGKHLWFSGNIGRFQQDNNRLGLTVIECVERWREVIARCFPQLDLRFFGTRVRPGTLAEYGTHLTRLDLAGNFYTSDYSALCSSLSIKRLGQHQARHGKYGPTWGYDTKRSNWVKGKVYDKTAEQQGRRTVTAGPTDARFEIQLGSEYLKRHQLDHVSAWSDETMDKIIYGKFASQLFRETASAEDWSNIPPRLRQYAILWRDGTDIRSIISKAQFYKTRAKLLDGFGIDIATPCNVIALTRHVRIIEVMPLPALRREAA